MALFLLTGGDSLAGHGYHRAVNDWCWRSLCPAWVGLNDEDYSDLIRKKAVAVTRRTKGVMANTASKKR